MKKSTKKTVAALGAVGATMAAAAGTYYLYGSKKASAHRRNVGAWMRKAEREIVREAKRLKNKAYTDQNIKRVIKEVAKRYEMARSLDPKDVKQFVAAVQKSWNDAGRTVRSRTGGMKTVKRAVKKARTSIRKVAKGTRSKRPAKRA